MDTSNDENMQSRESNDPEIASVTHTPETTNGQSLKAKVILYILKLIISEWI